MQQHQDVKRLAIADEVDGPPMTGTRRCFAFRRYRFHGGGGHVPSPNVPDIDVDDVRTSLRGLR